MPALKRSWLFLLLGTFACEGPTLWVGALRDSEVDSDADRTDASVDGGVTVRDAQVRDGGGILIIRCFDNADCTRELPRCHSDVRLCAQCEFDRDCKQSEWCDRFVCRPKDDDPRGPGGDSMGDAP